MKTSTDKATKRAIGLLNNPLESEEQTILFDWVRMMERRVPELRLMYHIPNGGYRHKATAGKLKAEGVKSGVPDICLPVARHSYHGLYIELKRRKGNGATDNQLDWIKSLQQEGYKAVVCYGFDEARAAIEEYLRKGDLIHADC